MNPVSIGDATLYTGDVLSVLASLPDESVLFEEIPGHVLFAMHPFVTFSAKRDDVGGIETQGFIVFPRFDVVCMKPATSFLGFSTPSACGTVALADKPNQFMPRAGSIEPLPFGRATVNEARVVLSCPAEHAISRSSKIRFRDGCLLDENGSRLCGMRMASERIRFPRFHEIVVALEIFSARARRYSKVEQLFIDAFRISLHDLCDVISRQPFFGVLLGKPIPIEMRRFHIPILTPNMAECQYV